MHEIDPQFHDAGINVAFVVIGTPEVAAEFCGRFGDASRCVADPHKRTYDAMGFGQFNLLRLFSDPALRVRRAENRAAGFRQDWKATKLRNGAQLPGAAIVDAAGIVRWVHRGTHPGDVPPMAELLDIARRYPGA